jgi:hypothetical protein
MDFPQAAGWLRALVVVLILGSLRCAGRADVRPHEPANASSNATAIAHFEADVDRYLTLHRQLEAELPKLPREATPEEIDAHQRALGARIAAARAAARQGALFTPAMERYLEQLFDRVFTGLDGRNLLGSIMDENPGIPAIAVNQRYPDSVPLSTMPPAILEALPELEEDMEYRFVGRRLVLFDAHAHLVVDFTSELLPAITQHGRDAR